MGYTKKKQDNTEFKGLHIKVNNNNVEKALAIFKRKVKDSGLMVELKKRQCYEKPSDIKRRKRNLAKLRAKSQQMYENNL